MEIFLASSIGYHYGSDYPLLRVPQLRGDHRFLNRPQHDYACRKSVFLSRTLNAMIILSSMPICILDQVNRSDGTLEPSGLLRQRALGPECLVLSSVIRAYISMPFLCMAVLLCDTGQEIGFHRGIFMANEAI